METMAWFLNFYKCERRKRPWTDGGEIEAYKTKDFSLISVTSDLPDGQKSLAR
jgi:hypothetical protein